MDLHGRPSSRMSPGLRLPICPSRSSLGLSLGRLTPPQWLRIGPFNYLQASISKAKPKPGSESSCKPWPSKSTKPLDTVNLLQHEEAPQLSKGALDNLHWCMGAGGFQGLDATRECPAPSLVHYTQPTYFSSHISRYRCSLSVSLLQSLWQNGSRGSTPACSQFSNIKGQYPCKVIQCPGWR